MIAEQDSISTVDRGRIVFEEQIAPRLSGENPDDFLFIDVLSGDYEISQDEISGRTLLRARHPNAVVYLRRVGDEAAYTVGGGFQE